MSGSSFTRPSTEFIIRAAFMMSLTALSIDMMLPALPNIGGDLGVEDANSTQLIVSLLMLGMAFGQIIYGPLSDSIGRKKAIALGYGVFVVGCVLCFTATTYEQMLLGRLLQGTGVAAPRIVTVAVIRDKFEGRVMAQILSYVMSVFILVPAIAPALGQGVMFLGPWQLIFVALLVLAIAAAVWFMLRQEETLPPERRRPYSFKSVYLAAKEVITHPSALGYTLITGAIQGSFLAYLNTSQQTFQVLYGLGEWFPACFAALALAIGMASIVNARIVVKYGMRKIIRTALLAETAMSLVFLGLALATKGVPPLPAVMVYLMVTLFCTGLLFGNLNALAMQPLGHIAGMGAAVVGAGSTLMSVPIGIVIGQAYNETVIPLVAGFLLMPALSLIILRCIKPQADD
ncbi:multidrug effflux MFS transporter [Pokkaliibacter sp. CJK22405]|uniref:multidrug effflux MFS transporter n=1 Tax=Pokkaliibacter sp. CJK22405 TaxID=3384615 RepID=UPI0039851E25